MKTRGWIICGALVALAGGPVRAEEKPAGDKAAAEQAAPPVIEAAEASNYVDKVVTVRGKVADAKYLESSTSKPTLLNFDAPHPKETFTVMIPQAVREKFDDLPEAMYFRKTIEVTGKVTLYRGKAQIQLTDPSQIKDVTPPAPEAAEPAK